MSYLYTGTTQSAATNTGLSTQILIKVDGQTVGAVQSLSAQQNRPTRRVQEVGTDGTVEIVPNSTTTVTLNVTRIAFDRKRLPESLQRGYINIHAQRIPFDVFVFDFSGVDPATVDDSFDVTSQSGVVTHVYENCWFQSLQTQYQATDYIITENCTLDVEFVHTFINGDPSVNASSGNPDFDDALERTADTNRRGSLDGRGLARVNDIFGVFQG